jgi:asparagine synthase (glutamine-hydrolysing)
MNNLIHHRGPDDEGYLTDFPGIALGHRRLSIIDLKDGHQPMSIGNFHIVYNGEIYNYKKLRAMLEKEGVVFKTHSDTEVLLQMYIARGPSCTELLEGMYAFIIYNSGNSTLFVARDPFGIKPLYYWKPSKDEIAFASEIKQFTGFPEWSPMLNKEMARDFLASGYLDHTLQTMFTGVFQIRGGTYIHGTLEEIVEKPYKYTNFTRYPSYIYNHDIPSTTKLVEIYLNDAVKSHLQADVPVGSCLSGGVDSPSIVALVEKNISKKQEQKTFSAISQYKEADESEYIYPFISSLNHVTPFYVEPDLNKVFHELDDLVWHMDEPFGSTSIYAQRCVFRKARDEKVKVILDGQGSDELFGGYDAYVIIRIRELLDERKYREAFSEGILSLWNKGFSPLYALVREKLSGSQHPSSEWLALNVASRVPREYLSVNNYSHDQLFEHSLPALLHYEDRNSMTFSIEARVPYLDKTLSDFVRVLPPEVKVRHGVTKWILREAVKGTLLDMLRLRKDKMGFATPEERWMKERYPEMFVQFENVVHRYPGIFHYEGSLKKFDRIMQGKEPFSFWVWRVIVFGKWMEVFGVQIKGE